MTGHQEIIDELEDSKDEILGRENSAEQRLKKAKKAHAKLQQAYTGAEKVRFNAHERNGFLTLLGSRLSSTPLFFFSRMYQSGMWE